MAIFFWWRVPELKEYLRNRVLKKTQGRKVELVVLAYGPNQLVINKDRSSIENKVKNKQDYLAIEL